MIGRWISKTLGIDELRVRVEDAEQRLTKELELKQVLKRELQETQSRKAELEALVETYQKPTEKELATEAKEPYVSIVRVELDPAQPGNGSFELDWNEYFVNKLVRNGYSGKSDEQIVDQWFQDVCRHVVLETYEQYDANTVRVTKRDLGNGRSEIS
jgi:hypothetical protein